MSSGENWEGRRLFFRLAVCIKCDFLLISFIAAQIEVKDKIQITPIWNISMGTIYELSPFVSQTWYFYRIRSNFGCFLFIYLVTFDICTYVYSEWPIRGAQKKRFRTGIVKKLIIKYSVTVPLRLLFLSIFIPCHKRRLVSDENNKFYAPPSYSFYQKQRKSLESDNKITTRRKPMYVTYVIYTRAVSNKIRKDTLK